MKPKSSIPSMSVSMITPSTAYVTPPITTYAIQLANLLPGDIEELPYFHTAAPSFDSAAAQKETPAEAAAFERFLDENFPDNNPRFAAFRRFIDNPQWNRVQEESRLFTYRVLTETRRQLRATARLNKWIALQEGHTVPPLRICEFCGDLFIAARKDKLTCSDRCSDGRKKRVRRFNQKQYELNRELNLQYKDKQRKLKQLKQKGASR
jgi:predicted nucleic acid-binding Zn ribbon protein